MIFEVLKLGSFFQVRVLGNEGLLTKARFLWFFCSPAALPASRPSLDVPLVLLRLDAGST